MDKEKELLKKRIFHLENAIKASLKISDLWLPRLPKDYYGDAYTSEYRALNTMYRLFERLIKE